MSRGLGGVEQTIVWLLMQSSKPITFAAMVESLLAETGYNGTFEMWRDDHPNRVRSIRRALHKLVRTSALIEIDGSPVRYAINPLDLDQYCNGSIEVAKALAISTVRRIQIHSDDIAKAEKIGAVKMAAQILREAFEHLALECLNDPKPTQSNGKVDQIATN